MKRIMAIAIVMVITVALCANVSATVNIDRLSINKNTLGEMMGNDINGDTLTIAKGDKVYILGWAFNGTSRLKEIVYTLDGAEKKCEDNYIDRPELAAALGQAGREDLEIHAGIGSNDAAMELLGLDQLDDGTYAMSIKAIYEDGAEELYKEFTLVVGTGVKAEDPAPVDPDPADPTPDNPSTADAAVLAVAAVACIALAGIVIAKKVK